MSSPAFEASLDDFVVKSKLPTQPRIDFVTTSTGAGHAGNGVRDLVLEYLFGKKNAARTAAATLASQLSASMDDRSPHSLLLFAAYRKGKARRLTLWAFPHDEPFHFSTSANGAKVRILQDAFSRSSSFTKAVLYEGAQTPSSFWHGRVIDKQAQGSFASAANYWVTLFLQSRSSLTGKAGTRLLAKCLKEAYDELTNPKARDEVAAAIIALHASNRTHWTLNRIKKEYLTKDASATFSEKIPEDAAQTAFTLDHAEFAKLLGIRVFKLGDGVKVSAPFSALGNSVQVTTGKTRTLKCEGVVVEEKVRSGNG